MTPQPTGDNDSARTQRTEVEALASRHASKEKKPERIEEDVDFFVQVGMARETVARNTRTSRCCYCWETQMVYDNEERLECCDRMEEVGWVVDDQFEM